MRRGFLLLPIVAVLAATSLLITAGATAQTTGDQAHGVGTIQNWPHCPTGSTVTFDFEATSGPSGEDAVGTFSFVCSPTGPFGTFVYSGTVTCLEVDGNVATVGGVVTASNISAFPVGEEFTFTVADGGPGGLNDRFSVLRANDDCIANSDETPNYPIVGEIVVVDVDPPLPAVSVVVTPPTAINEVGTQHTVTATTTTAAGLPAEGVLVRFTVEGSVETTGECTTGAQGNCTFTYTGPQLPGADLITACADNDGSGTIDLGEPCGEATKIWILSVLVSTPGQVTGGGWITSISGRVSFGFNAKSDDGEQIKGNCNVIDHAAKTQIRCLTVDALVVAGTHATFTGQARVDGVLTNYRIDVDDLGEPGVLDTFKIETDSGYTAAGRLDGGNIQIHR